MSFFSKIFGSKPKNKNNEPVILGTEDYNGYKIEALEMKQGSEFMLAGLISKTIDDELKTKKFIRADRLHSKEQASNTAINKGKQIIDQEGDALFNTPY